MRRPGPEDNRLKDCRAKGQCAPDAFQPHGQGDPALLGKIMLKRPAFAQSLGVPNTVRERIIFSLEGKRSHSKEK
jgi:hypothetical protein